jgi:hypothetical protein
MRNSVKLALGLLRRGAGYNWDSVTANSSDSPILAGQDAVVAVFDGANYLYCGKSAGTWKLLWVDTTGALLRGDTAGATPVTLASGASAGPFATAYGLATTRLAGSVAQGTRFTHEADALIEWTQVALPTFDYTRVTIRDPIPDEPFGRPEWWLMVSVNGALLLYERDDVGGGTQRASAGAGTVVNGDRVVAVAEGTTITGYSAGVQRWSYADATAYATATDGRAHTVSHDAMISDLIAWPRHLVGMAAAALEAV